MIYQITSSTWTGYIEIEFNANGLMTRTDLTNAELTDAQQIWFLKKMPREFSELQRVITGTQAKLTAITTEISFEDMWEKFDYKVGKKEALAKWNKMPKAEQIKAFNYVQKYKAKKLDTQAQLYLASYLNKERWND
ncbi:MAG: hypothetical protein WCR72_13530 [Bacteroidota bacterium]